MITTSREADFRKRQEGNSVDGRNSKASSISTVPWSRLKDPRIVRVSRAFGGKDRHSKVCTVRGLRDRRVRLSVPTAIQLYDLQERLGLNQPSKAVDWLLNVAKHEIDELPPLQMPPGNIIGQNHQPLLTNHGVDASQSNKERLKINNSVDWGGPFGIPRSNFWISEKSKEVATETADEKEKWDRRNEEEKQGSLESHGANVSPNNLFPRSNHSSSMPGLLNNVMPYNSFYRWDPSNFSLSHIGSHGFTPQTDQELQNFNVVPLPSTLSLQSGSQVLVYPPGIAQSYFPSPVATSSEFDPKQINHFQMLSSSSQSPLSNSLSPTLYSLGQSMKPLHLSMAPKLLSSQNSRGGQSNNNDDFPPK